MILLALAGQGKEVNYVENTVNLTESTDDSITEGEVNTLPDAASDEGREGNTVDGDGDGGAPIFEEGEEGDYDEEAELSELRRISGVEYGSLAEFSGYQRYLELKKSGVLTSEEAFYAVNRKGRTVPSAIGGSYSGNARFASSGSKNHMTASRRKPSSGEVFTRADREELAKWGISATGSELERLWREAGR